MSRVSDYKPYKKALPYSVTEDVAMGSADAYNLAIEAKSVYKRGEARTRAIVALQQVHQNLADHRAGVKSFEVLVIKIVKPSIISRIYNWFLTIQY